MMIRLAVAIVLVASVLAGEARNGWTQGVRAPKTTPVHLRVELVQRNLAELESRFWRVSDPSQPQHYGRFLTNAQVQAMIAPHPSATAQTQAFFQRHGLECVVAPHASDFCFVDATVQDVERVFDVEMHARHHPHSKATSKVASFGGFSMPSQLVTHVEHIAGIADFPPVRPPRKIDSSLSYPGPGISPPTILKTYGVPATPINATSGGQSVAEFEQAYFYETDLEAFEKKYGLQSGPLTKIVGKNDPNTGYLGECSLDVEYISAIGQGAPTWMFSLDELDLVQWALAVQQQPDAPLVHSISWGSGEANFDAQQRTRTATEMQKLGLMGFTVVVAAGDQGTGSTGTFSCGKFDATFPAVLPFVTAVGGTYLNPPSSPQGRETSWAGSGGGFSQFFSQPSYQASAVEQYLTTSASSLPASQYYNSSGRAIPDVAALATNYAVLIENYLGVLTGTSAATPVFAGMMTRINQERKSQGKSALGFVNPALYQIGKIGFDVVSGNNKNPSCPAGFPAAVGWDAVSGLGTPDFVQLAKALTNL